MKNRIFNLVFSALSAGLLSACGMFSDESPEMSARSSGALSAPQQRYGAPNKVLDLGNLLSEENDKAPNYYLWRAALEVTERLKYDILDPESGLIQTEEFQLDSDEVALKIRITGNKILSENVKVGLISSTFKTYPDNERDIKMNILKRAGALRKSELNQ